MSNYFQFTVLLFVFFSCGSKQEFVKPQVEKITETIYASGYVKSKDQYQVFSKANGILVKSWIQKGDEVKKGQVLFTISNEATKLNADNAQLVASNADLSNNMDKLRELSLNIEVSKKKRDNDKLVLERQRKLWADQIGTKFELEQRELAYSSSKAAYESGQLRYNELKKQLNFSSAQSQKSLSLSKSILSDYTVRCEFNGKVYSILKEQGEMVSPQMPLAVIGDATSYTVFLQVDENDIVQVIPGQKVFITMDSYKGQLFEGTISKVNPLMNERTRSFEVEANFTKSPETLYPNLTIEANIVLRTKENALTIPRKFLYDDEFVLISKKEKRKVKVGLKDYQKAEILEGLNKEDKIYLELK